MVPQRGYTAPAFGVKSFPMSTISIIDTHCHLDYIQRQEDHPEGQTGTDPVEVLARAKAVGVELLVNPSVTPARFAEVIALAERFDNVYAAVAVHPTDVTDIAENDRWLDEVEALLSHPKVVAIGETGLDYYWDTTQVDLQKRCFKGLLELGRKHDLPVIVHDREAHEDVAQMITEVPGVRGIMHCFSGDAAFARQMIEKNFYISFAGNLTFKKAENLHEAARETPLEWILAETDSPFLSPVPFRGKPNEPARVKHVVEKIAELKGLSYEEVAEATTRNARKVFGL
ncbi:MAG: hydrolase TatD [Vampirovibrio sp.]|nr:hydrolase TatD [Vampirovibrio sp.]